MRISRNSIYYAFDKTNKSVARVSPPCQLTFETCDCFAGQVTDEGQKMDSVDFSRVNPATGPVYVEGARPGDALKVCIRDIRLDTCGAMITAPGAGLLPDVPTGQTLLCPVENGEFEFKGIRLPLAPMIGVIGTAPAGEPVACGTPGDHGGNMDTTGIKPGSLLFLPVFVEGALLAMGDLHAAMGDGEVSVSGLEIAGEVDVTLDLARGMTLPCPLLKTDSELAFLASAPTTDEALERSVRFMNELLVNQTELNADEALMLMSATGQARISQVVDPLKTARFCMPLSVLKKFGVTLAF